MKRSAQEILETITDVIFAVDGEWRFVYSNRSAAETFGVSEGYPQGRILWEACPSALGSSLEAGMERARTDGVATDLEFHHEESDIWYEGRAYPAREIVSVHLWAVSAARHEDRNRRREERLFRRMVEGVKDYAILLLDPRGRIIEWNPGAERVKGYTAAEALGQYWSVFYTPEDRAVGKPERVLEEAISRGHCEEEGWRVRKDGSRFWANVVVTALRDDEGRLIGFAKITRDLTDRHRKEEMHRRRAEMVELLQAAAVVANEARSAEDAYRRVLERICAYTGWVLGSVFVPADAREELVATDYWCTADPERCTRFRRSVEFARFGSGVGLPGRAFASRRPEWVPDVVRDPGFTRVEEARAAGLHAGIALPVLTGSEVVAVLEFFSEEELRPDGLLLDTLANVGVQLGRVVERERAAEEVHRAREEAQRANRAKSEFLSRMSHELRTPMNAILGFAQLLEMEELPPSQSESVDQILKGGRYLLEIINEVLDIARIEAGRLSLSPEAVQVEEVLGEVLALVRPLAEERRVALPAAIPGAHGTHVRADRQRIKQVLLNLLSNAIKYNRLGGNVDVSCGELGAGAIRIAITDTGPGIAREKLERLFRPFERLGAEQSGVEGTGLGLALSRALVEAMGGKMGVESAPSQGSTFWLELPLGQVQPAVPEPEPASPLEHSGGEPVRRTLLYIEDNLSNLRLIQRIVAYRPGIQVIPAMQGSIGLELARKHRPDLILLDLNLPDLKGEEVLLRLRAEQATAEIPVIVVSADATLGQIERLRDSGAQDYLTKPIEVRRLLETIDAMLHLGQENE